MPAPSLLDALANFDRLPEVAFVRRPVVRALFGNVSDMTIDRWIKQGVIPGPTKLAERAVGWSVRELRRALAERPQPPRGRTGKATAAPSKTAARTSRNATRERIVPRPRQRTRERMRAG